MRPKKLSSSIPVVLKPLLTSDSPEGLVTAQNAEFLIHQIGNGAREAAFPTSSQVVLLLQVRGPHGETQRCPQPVGTQTVAGHLICEKCRGSGAVAGPRKAWEGRRALVYTASGQGRGPCHMTVEVSGTSSSSHPYFWSKTTPGVSAWVPSPHVICTGKFDINY